MTSRNPSPMDDGKSAKQRLIDQIADHVIEFYRLHHGPIVLMWRDVMNGFHLKLNPDYPAWMRDDGMVHGHWKRHGPGVVRILHHRRFTVVKVNRKIRGLVGHGKRPELDDRRRTASAYQECLPSSGRGCETMGMVVFPRDTQEDHPLIVASRNRRCKMAATSLTNSVGSVRDANDLGNLSSGTSGEILDSTHAVTEKAFTEERYPLFKESPAEPPPLPPPADPEAGPEGLGGDL